MTQEIWKDVPWYENLYKINKKWEVKNIKFNRLLKPQKDRYWYIFVSISKNGITKNRLLHRLLAITFIENPELKIMVNHKNWIKTDNRIENLEWSTSAENNLHAYRELGKKWAWTWKFWSENHSSKKVYQYTKELIFIKSYGSIREAWRETWIARESIWKVCLCKKWYIHAWWFVWKFKPLSLTQK